MSLCAARRYSGSYPYRGWRPSVQQDITLGACPYWECRPFVKLGSVWGDEAAGLTTGRDTSADRQQFLCKLDVCPTQSMSYGVVQDRHHLRIHCCDSNVVRCGRHRLRCNLKVFMFHFYKKAFDNCSYVAWMYFENHAYNNPYYQP